MNSKLCHISWDLLALLTMSGGSKNRELEDQPHLNDPMTQMQYRALRDTVRREIQESVTRVEDLVKDLEIEMNQQLGMLRMNIIIDIVRELRTKPPRADQGETEVQLDETDAEVAERIARERQARRDHATANIPRPLAWGRGNGHAHHYRGGGRGKGGDHHEDEDFDDNYDGYRCRDRSDCEEEKFDKLKFARGTDPVEYLTWELKVDNIFRKHNYSKDKKLAMASVEFDDYTLIWWEQVLNQHQANNERPIA